MPSSLQFYTLLIFCLLLAVWLTVAALRRANRARLAARLLAGLAAAAGLWFTAFPLTRTLGTSRREAILLTSDYQIDTLQQLLRKLGPATTVWRYNELVPAEAPVLASLPALPERHPALRRLHVLGRGLPAADASLPGNLQLVQHTPPAFTGFRAAHWNRQLELGKPVELEGFFENTEVAKAPVWVYLQAAGTARDSVKLPTGRGAFRLHFTPKATGLSVYELGARKQANTTLAREPVPVEVLPTRPLRVLLLASTPSFEFKFLKNQLGTQQHAVALRVGISKGLIQTEFLNQPAHDLSRLTPTLLARYDAVVADAGTLSGLSAGENQALQNAIRSQGLGLIVVADAAALPRTTPARAGFAVVPRATAVTVRPQPLKWPGAPEKATAVVPGSLHLSAGSRALVTDAQQQTLVADRRFGTGRVVIALVPETFRWVLQNATQAYDSYWSYLLSTAARPLAVEERWHVLETWPHVQQPLTLRLEAARLPAQQPTVQRAGAPAARLALRQDVRLPEWRTGQYWPTTAGWHRVQLPQKAAQWFYVYDTKNWVNAQIIDYQALNNRAKIPASASSDASDTVQQPWPVAWFFGVFLLAAGFLWLEEKL
ncbi:hypothetical protein [Hymenobacter sp. BT491]|uniref:hypothetical protein n=1 Tax=Hymenobacter sp. BT491 TaxID=2766779 RepID=UPI001653D32B|nr:hypothetical protein [Hymenobacter sp. BT491]MBC6991559.1 hypothetical protein [Hymenobacter sp. BT491]